MDNEPLPPSEQMHFEGCDYEVVICLPSYKTILVKGAMTAQIAENEAVKQAESIITSNGFYVQSVKSLGLNKGEV